MGFWDDVFYYIKATHNRLDFNWDGNVIKKGVDLVDAVKPNLETTLAEVVKYLDPNQTPDARERIATFLKGMVAHLPPGEFTAEDLQDSIVRMRDYLRPTVEILAKNLEIPIPELQAPPPNLIDNKFRTPSPEALFNLKVTGADGISMSLPDAAAAFSWTGAVPGIEFGYFDIADGNVRSVRLSPLPLPLAPIPIFTMLGFLVYGPIGSMIGATLDGPLFGLQVLYSTFPGYPAFFDVPVENGAPFTYLPSKPVNSAFNADIPMWPTSGSVPFVLGDTRPIPVFANLRTILAEDFGASAPPSLKLDELGEISTQLEIGSLDFEALGDILEPSELPKKMALPVVRAVRPTGLAFPHRLKEPAPVVISDPRRARTFLMVPAGFVLRGSFAWIARPLYHSEAGRMLRLVNKAGVSELYRTAAAYGEFATEQGKNGFDDSFVAPPAPVLSRQDCIETVRYDGATGVYNWELFYHLPSLYARQLAANFQFSEANGWLRKIFDPTFTGGQGPERVWRFHALHIESAAGPPASLTRILEDSNVSEAVKVWKKDPSDAHAVAGTRRGSYQRATVMQTVETLIAWGDKLFRENQQESINEAAMLYLAALDILGPRPVEVNAPRPAPRTYKSLRQGMAKLNPFGGAMVTIENVMSANGNGSGNGAFSSNGASNGSGGSSSAALSSLSMLYFGIPLNEKLRSYWDTVDDRLFKIRHSLDIQGRLRAGAFAGSSLAGQKGLGAWSNSAWTMSPGTNNEVPPPIYRFTFALQKANEFCAEVKGLGAALLSAYEKRDAEALARLRSDHEIRILEAAEQVRLMQIDEAELAVAAAEYSRDGARIRSKYYDRLSGEFMNAAEVIKETLSVASSVLQIGSGIAELAAAAFHAMPDFDIGAGAKGGALQLIGEGKYTLRYGASHVASAISAGGRALSVTSSVLGLFSSLAGTQATYQRRMEEWTHQRNLAQNDEAMLEKQIESAKMRLQIARTELENHRKQIANSREVADFMTQKFTSLELYQWMVEEISRTYLQTYELAYNLARNALRSYQLEHPDDKNSAGYISDPTWDSLRDGLLAGETLQFQLRQMENVWLARNEREIETVKHISLHQHDPQALIQLRETGVCYFTLSERIFDEDHPGQYMRRIKSVSLTIPCVAGPYTGVHCRLGLQTSSIRLTGDPQNPEFAEPKARTRSIATSSSQNDAGLFEVSFRDERYLPFEGEGAISTWQLELPKETNRFDFNTVSDVVLHLKYTARHSDALRETVSLALFGHELTEPELVESRPNQRVQAFSSRADFSNSWSRFVRGETETGPHVLDFDLSLPRFPYTAPNCRVELLSVEAVVIGTAGTKATWSWKEADNTYTVLEQDIPFAPTTDSSTPPRERLGGLPSVRTLSEDWPANSDPFRQWRITLSRPTGAAQLGAIDVLLLCEYRLVYS